ncbi:hypothetical protein P8452_32097 [Trifolium repens]|jgi:3-methyladenine DNA glycosylase Mpg|nr:hypothetical protein P8452_32097 [Trifolium repens]
MPQCPACRRRGQSSRPCFLGPFFPTELSYTYVHQVFGYCRILNWMTVAPAGRRQLLVRALRWEAQQRIENGEGGAYRAFMRKRRRLRQTRELLNGRIAQVEALQATIQGLETNIATLQAQLNGHPNDN